ncbi:CBS and ACT domain-containing protein [Macrococcus equipercicus]|uniref:CBS domain-containing protein n=1 Tax=Macrococcus equipercicus TaxID=69967 RepID=A0A9Q9F0T7_9STAP|nr:CBS and ACT domain-containing protein [Macrococcus equipercicus]UTH13197.1 CBS domain-containing protein [Macrococcus equipercicus]
MLVERIMTSPCLTINEERTIEQALELMASQDIRHLPVVDNDMKLLGIVTDHDINLALPSILGTEDPAAHLAMPVTRIMHKNVTTCHPLDFVEDIAVDFYELKLGSIPVIRNKQCIGIVTQKDMLNTFLELTGVTIPGSAIEVAVPDQAGIMHEVTRVFNTNKVSIESILVYRDRANPGYKLVLIRMQSINPTKIINDLANSGFTVRTPQNSGL